MKRTACYVLATTFICIGVLGVGAVGSPHVESQFTSNTFNASAIQNDAHYGLIEDINLSGTCSLDDPFGIRYSAFDRGCAGDPCQNKQECRNWGCDKCVASGEPGIEEPEPGGKTCTPYTSRDH